MSADTQPEDIQLNVKGASGSLVALLLLTSHRPQRAQAPDHHIHRQVRRRPQAGHRREVRCPCRPPTPHLLRYAPFLLSDLPLLLSITHRTRTKGMPAPPRPCRLSPFRFSPVQDEDVLSTYKIQSSHTVHMVKGAARSPASSSQPPAPQSLPNMQAGQNPHDPLTQLNGHMGYGLMGSLNPFAEMGLNPNDPNMVSDVSPAPHAPIIRWRGHLQSAVAFLSDPDVRRWAVCATRLCLA